MSQVILQPSEMSRTVLPSEVEYRRESSLGTRCIRVLCYGSEPRIQAWLETFHARGYTQKEPMSLGLEEIELFVIDARKELSL